MKDVYLVAVNDSPFDFLLYRAFSVFEWLDQENRPFSYDLIAVMIVNPIKI